jgi:hypothetical protein
MDEISDVLVECAYYARAGQVDAGTLAELRASLRSIFTLLAELFAASPSHKGWEADSRPGYLVRRLEQGGETLEIRVPWTILDGFPSDEVFAEFLGIAQRIRSGQDTAICLSGSAALHSIVQAVCDLDFCEYVEIPSAAPSPDHDRSFTRTFNKALTQEDQDLLCLRIHLLATGLPPPGDDKVLRRPWSTSPDDPEILRMARQARAGKCDFIAQTSLLGTVEVTNVVLLIEPDKPDEGPGRWSSPYQEAPIGAWVPRSLAEPLVMGDYINRLHKEAEKHLVNGRLGKAAKRLYALSTALFREELGDRLLNLFEEKAQELLLSAAVLARLDLLRRVRQVSDPAVLAFAVPLAQTVASLAREANRLDLPHIPEDEEAFAIWCEVTEQHLKSSPPENDSLRGELRFILEEMARLLQKMSV